MNREEAARVLHSDTCRKESVLMNADDWWDAYWEARRMGAEALQYVEQRQKGCKECADKKMNYFCPFCGRNVVPLPTEKHYATKKQALELMGEE